MDAPCEFATCDGEALIYLGSFIVVFAGPGCLIFIVTATIVAAVTRSFTGFCEVDRGVGVLAAVVRSVCGPGVDAAFGFGAVDGHTVRLVGRRIQSAVLVKRVVAAHRAGRCNGGERARGGGRGRIVCQICGAGCEVDAW